MKRTFIAIDVDLNQKMRDCLENLSSALANENISWIKKDRIHLTLKFLGDTEETRILPIKTILDTITQETSTFTITINQPGIFKNYHNPRIIWFGVEKNDTLNSLKGAIDGQLRSIGFLPDNTIFFPHLTMGRIKFIKNKSLLKEKIEEFSKSVFQQMVVKEIVFYESILRKQGAEYVPLGKFKFI